MSPIIVGALIMAELKRMQDRPLSATVWVGLAIIGIGLQAWELLS